MTGKTKNELIEKKIIKMIEYANELKLPFSCKLEETVKKYNTKQIVSMVEMFLIPAKNDMIGYLKLEFQNAKLYNLSQNVIDKDFNEYTPTQEQYIKFSSDILYIIKVIEY